MGPISDWNVIGWRGKLPKVRRESWTHFNSGRPENRLLLLPAWCSARFECGSELRHSSHNALQCWRWALRDSLYCEGQQKVVQHFTPNGSWWADRHFKWTPTGFLFFSTLSLPGELWVTSREPIKCCPGRVFYFIFINLIGSFTHLLFILLFLLIFATVTRTWWTFVL